LKGKPIGALEFLDNLFTPNAYADSASISPQAVAYTESRGMTPQQKLIPGPAGEIGTYQLTPIAFKDLQRLNPAYKTMDFFSVASNDVLAKKAMMDYMSLLETHYAPHYGIKPTDENLLQMYNVGPVAFSRGKRNSGYVKTYNKGKK
jgi:hypothetical protein